MKAAVAQGLAPRTSAYVWTMRSGVFSGPPQCNGLVMKDVMPSK
eukprot:CAMPEP_0172819808 /NCGR_PEP_ID=MMETSP1075-20121228/14853_1 /TAXON_ID=2916 /ORGANISM="Ceratium fusus, Strain PA161109" /LENGTH=43 /DNA_ID= /DNA_START= /DNA_END= /DNA_ORIENTATION=